MAEQKQTANKTQQQKEQPQSMKRGQNDVRTLLVRGYFVDENGDIRRQRATGEYIIDMYRLMSYNPAPKHIVIAGRGLAIAVACDIANKCQEIGMVRIVETKVSQINGGQRAVSQIEIITCRPPVKSS